MPETNIQTAKSGDWAVVRRGAHTYIGIIMGLPEEVPVTKLFGAPLELSSCFALSEQYRQTIDDNGRPALDHAVTALPFFCTDSEESTIHVMPDMLKLLKYETEENEKSYMSVVEEALDHLSKRRAQRSGILMPTSKDLSNLR